MGFFSALTALNTGRGAHYGRRTARNVQAQTAMLAAHHEYERARDQQEYAYRYATDPQFQLWADAQAAHAAAAAEQYRRGRAAVRKRMWKLGSAAFAVLLVVSLFQH